MTEALTILKKQEVSVHLSTQDSKLLHMVLDKEKRFELVEYQYELAQSNVIQGTSLSALKRLNKTLSYMVVDSLLRDFLDSIEVTSKPKTDEQIIAIVIAICKKYYHLRINELIYCFRRVQEGVYGKIYNRVDVNVIFSWLDLYEKDRSSFVQEKRDREHEAHRNREKETKSMPDFVRTQIDAMRKKGTIKRTLKRTSTPEDEAAYRAEKIKSMQRQY